MILKKRLGQHFLNSPALLEYEAVLANPRGRATLEIGPGDGRLTKFLLAQKPSSLTVVEKDPRWADHIRHAFPQVKVIEGDFLEREGLRAEVIAGNLPYYASSQILFKLAEMDFRHAVLMVQLEFAKRMSAKPGTSTYGRLSVTSQLHFDIKLVKKVGRGAFIPPPDVDSAIVLLRKKPFRMEKPLEKFIRILFQHKNQNIRNALRHGGIEIPPALALPQKRARQLSKEEILNLYAEKGLRALLQ
ncbi:MAG: 16S rRNA (adenine(1518)-N(6)/adenine(1519)-N(6))-dimethyltransferase RsmA [Candidatus Bilamarchaeaceae archaeon]